MPLASTKKSRNKLEIELFLAPSDVPEYIFAESKPSEDELHINFKYNDHEDEKQAVENPLFRLVVGIYSGKVLRIELRGIGREGIGEIELTRKIKDDVVPAIEERIKDVRGLRARSNLQRAEQVLTLSAGHLASIA